MSGKFSDAIRRIKDVGYLRDLDDDSPEESRLMVDQSGPGESRCFDIGGGAATILTYLRFVCSRPVRISGFGALTLLDTRVSVDWWVNEAGAVYRADPGLEFEYEEILNHHVEQGLLVRPSYPVEGWVIGRIYQGFPQGLLPGVPLNTVLEIYYDPGELYEPELQFMLELHTLRRTRRRSTLYDTSYGQSTEPKPVSGDTALAKMDIMTDKKEAPKKIQ